VFNTTRAAQERTSASQRQQVAPDPADLLVGGVALCYLIGVEQSDGKKLSVIRELPPDHELLAFLRVNQPYSIPAGRDELRERARLVVILFLA